MQMLIGFLLLAWACTPPLAEQAIGEPQSAPLDTPTMAVALDTFWGYRFEVVGDFDGDGFVDTLRDRFVDPETGWETFRSVYEANDPLISMSFNSRGTAYWEVLGRSSKVLSILRGESAAWMEALPDLDGDGSQELCVVFNHQDCSNVNRAIIYTWKGAWSVLYMFQIRELSDVPQWPKVVLHRDSGGRPYLRLAETREARAAAAALTSHTLVHSIRPNVFEVRAYEPYGLKGLSAQPSIITDTCAWFEVASYALPKGVRSSQVAFDLMEYNAEERAAVLEELYVVEPLDSWYDFAMAYWVRVEL